MGFILGSWGASEAIPGQLTSTLQTWALDWPGRLSKRAFVVLVSSSFVSSSLAGTRARPGWLIPSFSQIMNMDSGRVPLWQVGP